MQVLLSNCVAFSTLSRHLARRVFKPSEYPCCSPGDFFRDSGTTESIRNPNDAKRPFDAHAKVARRR